MSSTEITTLEVVSAGRFLDDPQELDELVVSRVSQRFPMCNWHVKADSAVIADGPQARRP